MNRLSARFFLLAPLGVESCAVLGHHTGAAVAVQLAHNCPGLVNAMALSGPMLLTEEQKNVLPESGSPFAMDEDGGHLTGMWQRLRGEHAGVDPALTQRELFSAFACGDAYQGSYPAVCAQDFSGQLVDTTCPELVFAGDADPLRDAVVPTAERLIRAEVLEVTAGAGTYIFEQRAEFLAARLAGFLPGTNKRSVWT